MPKVQYNINRGLHQVAGKGLSLNHLDFLAGNTANLTGDGVAILDAQADAGEAAPTVANIKSATLSGSAVNTCNHGGAAAGAIYLPAAEADTHLALRFAAELNAGGHSRKFNIVSTGSAPEVLRGNTAVFAKQVIGPIYNNIPASVVTTGTDAVPTGNKLVYTVGNGNNILGNTSVIHFYCQTEGQWLVKVFNVAQGTGANGAFTIEVGD